MKEFDPFVDFVPWGKQLDFLIAMESEGFKYALLRWHRQFGKDLVCWLYMIRHAIQNPGSYYYFFPMIKQAKRALWNKNDPALGGKVRNWIPQNLIVKQRDDEMVIEFNTTVMSGKKPLTSIIHVVGADAHNIDDYAGISPNGVVFSEVGPNSHFPAIIGLLLPTIIANDAYLILNSTPRGKNHFYRWELESVEDPEWFVSVAQTLWPTEPNYTGPGKGGSDPEKIWKFNRKSGRPDWWIEQEYGVSYEAKVDGSYYETAIKASEDAGKLSFEITAHPRYPVSTYWDLGTDDDMVCWFKQDTPQGEIIIDYWQDNTGMDIDDIAKMLVTKGYYYVKHQLPWDGNTRQKGRQTKTTQQHFKEAIKAYKCTGLVTVAKRDSRVQHGIERTRSEFHRFVFAVSNAAVAKGVDHLRGYKRSFNKTSQQFTDVPDKNGHQHAADAFRNLTSDEDPRVTEHRQLTEGSGQSLTYTSGVDDESEW